MEKLHRQGHIKTGRAEGAHAGGVSNVVDVARASGIVHAASISGVAGILDTPGATSVVGILDAPRATSVVGILDAPGDSGVAGISDAPPVKSETVSKSATAAISAPHAKSVTAAKSAPSAKSVTASNSSSVADEDNELAAAAKGGDMSAFETLVERYERRVYSIAVRMLTDQEDARDAAQDTFLRVFRGLPGFQGESKFSTWIYRIVTNICVDKLRKRRDNAELSLDAPFAGDDSDSAGAAFELPDASVDIAAIAEGAEFRALVQRAVAMLPDAHRAIIVMRDFEGISYPEIAKILSCQPGTVKSRINRARQKLRAILCGMTELEGYFIVKQV